MLTPIDSTTRIRSTNDEPDYRGNGRRLGDRSGDHSMASRARRPRHHVGSARCGRGGGPVATLEGLRPLLRESQTPRAVAVSSIGSLRPPIAGLVDACLSRDEGAALTVARSAYAAASRPDANPRDRYQAPLDLYGTAKLALQQWCRAAAPTVEWAGAGISLNVVAFGFVDTPAAAFVLGDPANRAAVGQMMPLKTAYPGRPEDAAAILAWCVAPENVLMTGQILFADAGFECLGASRKPSAGSA